MLILTYILLKSFIYLPKQIIDRIKNNRRQHDANGGLVQRSYRQLLSSFRSTSLVYCDKSINNIQFNINVIAGCI